MSLQILMGASGHGKSFALYNRITKQAGEHPEQRYIVVVPEQSSLQAEKDIVRASGRGGIFNIEVLTFGRMCFKVFDELGIEPAETVDDTGKNLIVRKVMDAVGERLVIIKPGRRQGFVSEVKSMISELKQYGITPENLGQIAGCFEKNGRLWQKLSDIGLIYSGFEEYIRGRYTTVEDRPEAMLAVLERSRYFKGAVVAFDGFTGFTPVQYGIIEKIADAAQEIILTVTLPDDEPYNVISGEEDLFYMSKNMIARAGKIADRLMLPIRYERLETDYGKYRFAKSEELRFLEKNLLRYNGMTYGKEVNDIKLYKLDSIRGELQFAAAAILKHVREDGLRFRDIAVVAGDMQMYTDDAVRIFGECGIPFFVDAKRSLIGNPLVEYIRAAVEIAETDYSYESVFRFLKNGLCAIDRESTDILENYVLARGIRGRNCWSRDFSGRYPGKAQRMDEVNRARKIFYESIADFDRVFCSRESTVSDFVLAIYELLESARAFEQMEELADALEKENPADMRLCAKASEYRRSYGMVIGLLEQTDALMGDRHIEKGEFARILDAGFEELKVGIIPPAVDCITVGDIERTRLEHVKVLIMLGVNEGIIPKLSANRGVLSEAERMKLAQNNVELAPSLRERVFIQNFYLYLNMTEPEQGLYMLCHKVDESGRESKPSRIFSMMKKMYPALIVHDGIFGADALTNPQNSRHLLAGTDFSDESDETLFLYYLRHEPYASEFSRLIEFTVAASMPDSLTHTAASRLYGSFESSSITRMETFAACAFSHFARYGLELEERRVHRLNRADMGTVFHKAIEMFFEMLPAQKKGAVWALSDSERGALVEKSVDHALEICGMAYLGENATNRFMRRRITEITDRTVWALGEQLKKGSFEPTDFERVFEVRYGNTVITGKIDRVDTARTEDAVYVKIVDYKSGRNDINPDEIYAGLKLQLMVYLGSAIERAAAENPGMAVVAAGAFYNCIDNPIIKKKPGADDRSCERELLKEMRPTGAVGLESAELLDDWESDESLVIPAKRKKDGLLSVGGHIYTDAQLKCLAGFALGKLSALEKEIRDGVIAANPYEHACDFCPYSTVCGFCRDGGQICRKPEKITDAPDMWEKFGYREHAAREAADASEADASKEAAATKEGE